MIQTRDNYSSAITHKYLANLIRVYNTYILCIMNSEQEILAFHWLIIGTLFKKKMHTNTHSHTQAEKLMTIFLTLIMFYVLYRQSARTWLSNDIQYLIDMAAQMSATMRQIEIVFFFFALFACVLCVCVCVRTPLAVYLAGWWAPFEQINIYKLLHAFVRVYCA